jgi:hypothetical protein
VLLEKNRHEDREGREEHEEKLFFSGLQVLHVLQVCFFQPEILKSTAYVASCTA